MIFTLPIVDPFLMEALRNKRINDHFIKNRDEINHEVVNAYLILNKYLISEEQAFIEIDTDKQTINFVKKEEFNSLLPVYERK